jgi:GNAT superfamily N-acetyltransferase
MSEQQSLFAVRFAEPRDDASIVALEHDAIRELHTFRGAPEFLLGVPDRTSENIVVVLEHLGTIVAFASMAVVDNVAIVERIYVVPHARELGAGATLIEFLSNHARQQNCTRLESYALPGDRQTKNLFERAGMKARLLTVSTVL